LPSQRLAAPAERDADQIERAVAVRVAHRPGLAVHVGREGR
jgi:hypothetical protein